MLLVFLLRQAPDRLVFLFELLRWLHGDFACLNRLHPHTPVQYTLLILNALTQPLQQSHRLLHIRGAGVAGHEQSVLQSVFLLNRLGFWDELWCLLEDLFRFVSFIIQGVELVDLAFEFIVLFPFCAFVS